MSADLLGEAADLLREWWPDCECHSAEREVADMLDHCAKFAGWRDHVGDGPTADLIDHAVRVARAYLGESA